MRNKVYLIKGWLNIANRITSAEFERINAGHVVLITALRRPQSLPVDMNMDPTSMLHNCKKVMEHWRNSEQDHFLIAEYASILIDHGGKDVWAVEGEPLNVPWFFETVKSLHKSFGQIVEEIQVLPDNTKERRVKINNDLLTEAQIIELLSVTQFLG